MIGRGTRLHPETDKISFKIYDYTNATRLFGQDFISKQPKPTEPTPTPPPPPPIDPTIEITHIDVAIQKGETYFLLIKDGKDTRVSFAEYREYVRALILEKLPTVTDFVQEWIEHPEGLLNIPELQTVLNHDNPDYDSFDVIADLAYQITPKTKHQRVADFLTHSEGWLVALPNSSANTLRAVANVFEENGTNGLNSGELFNVIAIKKASGGSPIKALKLASNPNEVFKEFKTRIFRLANNME
jgi:type I restriction enzyme, R subunit